MAFENREVLNYKIYNFFFFSANESVCLNAITNTDRVVIIRN